MAYDVDTASPAPFVPTRNALKAVLLLVLFFATFLASTGALVLKRSATTSTANSRGATIFSLVSCFGGGVLLATCLMHLLPESKKQIDEAEKMLKWSSDFPLAELCISLGFIFVLLVEQGTVFAYEKGWIGSSDGHHLLHSNHDAPNTLTASTSETPIEGAESTPLQNEHFEHQTHSTMRAVILTLAISLHAVFEGLSVGMIVDVAALLQICGALLVHKLVVGISLGIRLVQSHMRPHIVVLCCLIFSGQILIGGFIGLGIMNALNHHSLSLAIFVSGILQAFAAGTFLYITCFEILNDELNKHGYRPLKVLTLGAGFALITMFIIVFPDADDGDNKTQRLRRALII